MKLESAAGPRKLRPEPCRLESRTTYVSRRNNKEFSTQRRKQFRDRISNGIASTSSTLRRDDGLRGRGFKNTKSVRGPRGSGMTFAIFYFIYLFLFFPKVPNLGIFENGIGTIYKKNFIHTLERSGGFFDLT